MQCLCSQERQPPLSTLAWALVSYLALLSVNISLVSSAPVLPPAVPGGDPITGGSAVDLPTSRPHPYTKSTGSSASDITVQDIGDWTPVPPTPHNDESNSSSNKPGSSISEHGTDSMDNGVILGTCQRRSRERVIKPVDGKCTNVTVDVGACEGGCSSREAPVQHGDFMTLRLQPDGSYAAVSRTRCKCCTSTTAVREASVLCVGQDGVRLKPRIVRYHSVASCSCNKCR